MNTVMTSVVGPPTSRGVAKAPTDSTKTSTDPETRPGSESGRMTWRNVATAPAPRLCEASSSATSTPWRTGRSDSTMKGSSTSASAMTTPTGVNRSWTGRLTSPVPTRAVFTTPVEASRIIQP